MEIKIHVKDDELLTYNVKDYSTAELITAYISLVLSGLKTCADDYPKDDLSLKRKLFRYAVSKFVADCITTAQAMLEEEE